MTLIKLGFTCPVCGVLSPLVVKRPTHWQPSITKVKCKSDVSGCESVFQVAVDATKERDKSKIDVLNFELSPKGIQITRDKKGAENVSARTN